MTSLVTGAGGFVGGHLVEQLLAQGAVVHALSLAKTPFLEELRGSITVHTGDIADRAWLDGLLPELRPDHIFHLAAQSYPMASWEDPLGTFRTNVLGTVNLLESMRKTSPSARTVVACSAAEYAAAPSAEGIAEGARLEPSSPYGVSKLAQDEIARLYVERYGMHIVRVRPFALAGPRKQGDVYGDLARGVVAVERGEAERLSVGDLAAVRDVLDIRDGVSALLLLAERGTPGEVYNLCSGRGHRIGDILAVYKGLSTAAVQEEVDPSRLRPMDDRIKVGNPARLKALGWEPKHDLVTTLRDILAYWRELATRE